VSPAFVFFTLPLLVGCAVKQMFLDKALDAPRT
jgi:hypothetical protein